MGPTYRPRNRRRHQQARVSPRMKDVWSRRPVPAGGRRGASASLSACVQTPESLTASGSRARALARGPELAAWLGTGSPLDVPRIRPGVAPEPEDTRGWRSWCPAFSCTAVARNRLRRRLKEISQTLSIASLPVVDLVVRANGPHTPRRFARCARIDDERDAVSRNLQRWPRRAVMALIRVYQLTLRIWSHAVSLRAVVLALYSSKRWNYGHSECVLGIKRILRCHPPAPRRLRPSA